MNPTKNQLQTIAAYVNRQVEATMTLGAAAARVGAPFPLRTAVQRPAASSEDYKNGYKVGAAKGAMVERSGKTQPVEAWVKGTSPTWQRGWLDGIDSVGASVMQWDTSYAWITPGPISPKQLPALSITPESMWSVYNRTPGRAVPRAWSPEAATGAPLPLRAAVQRGAPVATTEDYRNGYKVGAAKGVMVNRSGKAQPVEAWVRTTNASWQRGWLDGIASVGAGVMQWDAAYAWVTPNGALLNSPNPIPSSGSRLPNR